MYRIVAAIAALILCGGQVSAQDVRFPRAGLDEASFHRTIPTVRAFLARLQQLENEGAFETGAGTKPRDDLGGLSAKNWLLAQVDPGFECRRDFGGVCGSPDPRIRFAYAFLSDEGWGAIGPDGPDIYSPSGLAALSLSFRSVLTNIDLASGQNESCVLAIASTRPDLDTVMAEFLGGEGPGMLEAYDNFVGVVGRYRVRAAPSIRAQVVNGIADEVIFLPGPGQTYTVHENDQTLVWTYVVPASGPSGFAALQPSDTVALSAVASQQICVAQRDGRVVITAYSGAGD